MVEADKSHQRRRTEPTSLLGMLVDEFTEIHGAPPKHAESLQSFHAACHETFPRTALCLSGGGIRSAAFNLGVLQWLAAHRLLEGFQYLSTVSGGGYIGSWLSAWLYYSKKGYGAIRDRLAGQSAWGGEAAPILRLRAYSQYLTPRVGLLSGDTWASIAISLRNLVLNWLILIPFFGALVLLPQLATAGLGGLIASGSASAGASLAAAALYLLSLVYMTGNRPRWATTNLGQREFFLYCLAPAVAAACLAASQLPLHAARAFDLASILQRNILLATLLYLAAWVMSALVLHLTARRYPRLFQARGERLLVDGSALLRFTVRLSRASAKEVIVEAFTVDRQAVATKHYEGVRSARITFPAGTTRQTLDVKLYRDGLIDGVPIGPDDIRLRYRRARGASVGPIPSLESIGVDLLGFILAGWVFAFCVSLGEWLVAWLSIAAAPSAGSPAVNPNALFIYVCASVPWLLGSHLMGELALVAVTSRQPRSDEDREWLGRAAGWFLVVAMAWFTFAALVLFVPLLPISRIAGTYETEKLAALLSILTTASGFIAALIGRSATTPAQPGQRSPGYVRLLLYAFLSIFLVSLTVGLSLLGDMLLLKQSFHSALQEQAGQPNGLRSITAALGFGVLALPVIALLAGLFVNVNHFSLHAMYRNRLVRAFLGASNRRTWLRNRFTWFNQTDNIEMHRLWDRERKAPQGDYWRPFHVINTALNLVASPRLAWQERKAEPFTITPLWCGSGHLDAFRRSSEFGGRERTITLGTAMAISGAAVSPNMGYNSSPLVTLLLTLFNVRLGWWVGNPKHATTYATDGPRFAFGPLLAEALGMTSNRRPYVYLSDGGHFDNLGLYEMIRRRCHLIVLCDAGRDPACHFADLASTKRKISIDLGIDIHFPSLTELRKRNNDWTKPDLGGPGFTIGHIDYQKVDGPEARQGILLYIKPSLRGDEPADIVGYAAVHQEFPHESTTDQWFTESQFESYRALGHWMMQRLNASGAVDRSLSKTDSPSTNLERLLTTLAAGTLPCGGAARPVG